MGEAARPTKCEEPPRQAAQRENRSTRPLSVAPRPPRVKAPAHNPAVKSARLGRKSPVERVRSLPEERRSQVGASVLLIETERLSRALDVPMEALLSDAVTMLMRITA